MKFVRQIIFGGVIVITLIAIGACGRPTTTECFPGKSRPIHEIETTVSKYLPKKFLIEDLKRNDSEAETRLDKWHSEQLLSLKEASLLASSTTGEETYRFLWTRSFHEPISVRVTSIGNKREIFIKKTDSKGNSSVGKLIFDHSRSMSNEEWQQFMLLLENTCFWGM